MTVGLAAAAPQPRQAGPGGGSPEARPSGISGGSVPKNGGHTPRAGATNRVSRPSGSRSKERRTGGQPKLHEGELPMRRLILAALALFAFLALESCGVSRLAGPTSNAHTKPTVIVERHPAAEHTAAAAA